VVTGSGYREWLPGVVTGSGYWEWLLPTWGSSGRFHRIRRRGATKGEQGACKSIIRGSAFYLTVSLRRHFTAGAGAVPIAELRRLRGVWWCVGAHTALVSACKLRVFGANRLLHTTLYAEVVGIHRCLADMRSPRGVRRTRGGV